jgi:hypothetical protein
MRGLQRLFLVLLVILSETFAVHQDSLTTRFHNQVGIALGSTIGNGLSYRRRLNDRYALQITGAYLSSTTTYRGLVSGYEMGWVNTTGIAMLCAIQMWKTVRTLVYFGTSYNSRGYVDNGNILVDSVKYPYLPFGDYNDKREEITIGNGFGIDCYLWRFGLNLMAGLHYGYSPFEKKYLPPSPSLEAGLFFCW